MKSKEFLPKRYRVALAVGLGLVSLEGYYFWDKHYHLAPEDRLDPRAEAVSQNTHPAFLSGEVVVNSDESCLPGSEHRGLFSEPSNEFVLPGQSKLEIHSDSQGEIDVKIIQPSCIRV